MKIAKPLLRLIESFQKLPGIGPKTAQRLTYYLLHVPQGELDNFAKALFNLKKDTVFCSICKNVSETDPCPICLDANRDASVIMVVEQPLDILAFERTGKYQGLYHVLHGAINPLENIGPDEIYLNDLFERMKNGEKNPVKELIIATNPTMEGDATAMYISKKLKVKQSLPLRGKSLRLKVTRLGMGIPTGADLEYADDTTLTQALEGRRSL
ncbi:recombination protein RecR [Candidatus Woesebacteria bacterium RBG_16_34_12]|uniref:Recombination protein RecR n=1 Tax=Candidatus Woesebacteria bacterium RBG_16_34_12 TaxID=1802480 RepID=A0A1F7X9L7_9BACT|nr:MAG: recombination protein RecR [Candidatus Woesebacteria bacterium RBG_16_34_12]